MSCASIAISFPVRTHVIVKKMVLIIDQFLAYAALIMTLRPHEESNNSFFWLNFMVIVVRFSPLSVCLILHE